jgi:ribose transport system substrate-binding protein
MHLRSAVRVTATAFVLLALAAIGPNAAAQPQPSRSLKIALIAKSEANFVFLSARKGAEDAAAALSRTHNARIEVLWRTPQAEDAQKQAERIAEAVKEGVGAILIACSDEKVLTPAIDAAVAAGVPVMTFDSDAPSSKRFSFYGPDDNDIGEKLAAELATMLGPKGKIAVLAGNPAAPNLKARTAGVNAGAAKRGLTVVEVVHHAETPQDSAAAVIKTNAAQPELGGWAMVGGWPLFRSGQTQGFTEDLLRRKLKIAAVDALPEQLGWVQRDIVPVLWAQPTYTWGERGVIAIVDKVLLNKPVPPKIRMDLVRVTKANLGDWARRLKTWGFTGIPDDYLKLP